MKRLFGVFLIFLNCNVLLAQVEVTGQVKDSKTKNILEFCSVSAVSPKDSLIKGSVTDNNGFFSISLNEGNYRFIISFIGYKADTTDVIGIEENKFLGVFKLNQDEKYLKEVSVNASSHENLIDRDEQVVTDKMKAGASDTKDVLQKINGVEYNEFSNTIKVDNDSKVLILVDGMEKDQEYIMNLSPDRLKKVVVIRSPGGRYALEGYTAVINIILKKDYQGTEIYFKDRIMEKPDAGKTQPFPAMEAFSGSINYVYNNLSIYAKYRLFTMNYNSLTTDQKEYNNGLVINEGPSPSGDMNTILKQLNYNYILGADYYINPKNTISFESNLATSPMSDNVNSQYYNLSCTKGTDVLENLITQTTNQSDYISTDNSLFYEGKPDENNVINSSFTYHNYHDSYKNVYTDNLFNNINEQGNDIKDGTKFDADYTHTFKDKTSLQIGYGNTWRQQNNNYTADTLSKFKYTDMRNRFFAYYSWDISKKFSLKFGGAAETSAQDANGIKNTYLIFEPYANIKYTFSKMLNMVLKYRSNSAYPDITQTNPFITVIDAQSEIIGNPLLRPAVTNQIRLQTDILGGLITIEPYYQFANNFITETGKLINDSIFEYSFSNAGYYRHYGSELRFAIPIGKSFSINSDFDFFKSSIETADKTNNINDWLMSGSFNYENEKSGTVIALIFERDSYKDITAEGYNIDDFDDWMLYVEQAFFKQKLNVSLMYFLPVNLGMNYITENYINVAGYSESRNHNMSFIKNVLGLKVSYRFNKGKTVNPKEKNIEQENEKKNNGKLQ